VTRTRQNERVKAGKRRNLGIITDLGELDSIDVEVSPDTEGGESENEGGGEKSGVHRRDISRR